MGPDINLTQNTCHEQHTGITSAAIGSGLTVVAGVDVTFEK